MQKLYKFLFYKLYRFAVAEEKSVSLNFNFILLATVFQELHLALLPVPLKYFNLELIVSKTYTSVFLLIFLAIINYFYFIKSKKIEKINSYFQNQKRIVWRDNLLFFGYIILLFVVMFFQVFILKKI